MLFYVVLCCCFMLFYVVLCCFSCFMLFYVVLCCFMLFYVVIVLCCCLMLSYVALCCCCLMLSYVVVVLCCCCCLMLLSYVVVLCCCIILLSYVVLCCFMLFYVVVVVLCCCLMLLSYVVVVVLCCCCLMLSYVVLCCCLMLLLLFTIIIILFAIIIIIPHFPTSDQHLLDPGWQEIPETDLDEEIDLPRRVQNEPPFLCQEGWLEEKIQTIWNNFIAKDEDRGEESRIKPMALVRCSRGGKTRALKEIAYGIKNKADRERMENFRVISISFNDFSPPSDWEKKHPTKAICRRIAFAAMFEGKEGLSEQFKKFKKTATKATILSWLGEGKEKEVPCLLLIDELNALKMIDQTEEATECASFLKEYFLTPANRYLVFTSHIFSPAKKLADYMDNESKRGVDIEELPIIQNVRSVQQQFGFPVLTARMALYYGLAPSLIYLSCRNQVPDLKESELSCTSDLSDSEVRLLLKNFFTGNRIEFPEKLNSILPLMSVGRNGVLHWIPCFMVEVLTKFSSCGKLSNNLGCMLCEISDLFKDFKCAQEGSGSAWESLFVIALLLRCLSLHFDDVILPLDRGPFAGASVSYNQLLNQSLTDLRTIDDLVSALKKPVAFPHIAVFYPNHANFEMIDVLVAVYPNADSRSLYGYQLKEHNEIPTREVPDELGQFFVIRGKSMKNSLRKLRKWHRPSTPEIKNFFGESGMHWTPERWGELSEDGEKQKEEENHPTK